MPWTLTYAGGRTTGLTDEHVQSLEDAIEQVRDPDRGGWAEVADGQGTIHRPVIWPGVPIHLITQPGDGTHGVSFG